MIARKKPASRKLIAANRRNARKSTGPKSAAGKRKVSRNALQHGLAALVCPVLPFENESDYKELAEALERDLRPVGVMQREVFNQITQIAWKLRRIPAIEAALLQHDFGVMAENFEQGKEDGDFDADATLPSATSAIILAGHFAKTGDRPYERLEMYRTRLQRSLESATRHLKRLREETAGEELSVDHAAELVMREMDRAMAGAREAREFAAAREIESQEQPRNDASAPVVREDSKTNPEAQVDQNSIWENKAELASDGPKPWPGDEKRPREAATTNDQ